MLVYLGRDFLDAHDGDDENVAARFIPRQKFDIIRLLLNNGQGTPAASDMAELVKLRFRAATATASSAGSPLFDDGQQAGIWYQLKI